LSTLTDVPAKSDVAIGSYPLVFAVTTLPLSVVRWRSGFGSTSRRMPTATFVVEFIYSLSGAVNVLLFLLTRPELLLPRNISSKRNKSGAAPGLAGSKTDGMNFTISRLEARQRSRASQKKNRPRHMRRPHALPWLPPFLRDVLVTFQ